jgi:hypothetical protein
MRNNLESQAKSSSSSVPLSILIESVSLVYSRVSVTNFVQRLMVSTVLNIGVRSPTHLQEMTVAIHLFSLVRSREVQFVSMMNVKMAHVVLLLHHMHGLPDMSGEVGIVIQCFE